MKTLRWYKSNDGFTNTHCLHYKLTPEYWGRCHAQSYGLIYFPNIKTFKGSVRLGSHDTQQIGKQQAQDYADKLIKNAI